MPSSSASHHQAKPANVQEDSSVRAPVGGLQHSFRVKTAHRASCTRTSRRYVRAKSQSHRADAHCCPSHELKARQIASAAVASNPGLRSRTFIVRNEMGTGHAEKGMFSSRNVQPHHRGRPWDGSVAALQVTPSQGIRFSLTASHAACARLRTPSLTCAFFRWLRTVSSPRPSA